MEAPIARPDGGRGFSLAASAGACDGRLVDQSQLAVALSCGLTTSIGNNFARAVAEREAHQCKTQSYSDIQHQRPKPDVAFGSVRGVLVPSNENTEYFKSGHGSE